MLGFPIVGVDPYQNIII